MLATYGYLGAGCPFYLLNDKTKYYKVDNTTARDENGNTIEMRYYGVVKI